MPRTLLTEARHGRTTRALGLMVACLVLATSAPATARVAPEDSTDTVDEDEPGEPRSIEETRQDVRVQVAERHYVEGMVLFNRGQYREAAAEFERSYAAIPAARTLYSIGLSHERAGQTIPAIEACERYLALPDCDEPGVDALQCAEQRTEVTRSVERLRRFVGELQLDLAAGVQLREVRVSGRVVPVEDFPILLMPGAIEVELFGREPEDHSVRLPRITAGQTYVLRVTPFRSAPPPQLDPEDGKRTPEPPLRDPAEERRRREQLRRGFWAGLGITAASGAATGALGGFTIREDRLFYKQQEPCHPFCDEDDPNRRDYPAEHERRFNRLRIATNAMIGVTAAFGVATVVLGVLAFSRKDKSTQRANVRLTGSGLSVRF